MSEPDAKASSTPSTDFDGVHRAPTTAPMTSALAAMSPKTTASPTRRPVPAGTGTTPAPPPPRRPPGTPPPRGEGRKKRPPPPEAAPSPPPGTVEPPMSRMRKFWNERAREDAFHFVDNREPYGQADEER